MIILKVLNRGDKHSVNKKRKIVFINLCKWKVKELKIQTTAEESHVELRPDLSAS